MPEIVVSTFIRHNTSHDIQRNEDEWAAIHAKKIIKGEPLAPKARFMWPLRSGYNYQIKENTRSTFEADVLARFADHITANHAGAVIVPVPNGDGAVGVQSPFRTLQLARMLAANSPHLSAMDALRWHEPMGKAHKKERRRDVDAHMAALRIMTDCPRDVIVFDDVVTSGSQLCAAKLKLEEAGFNVLALYAIFDVIDEGERGSAPGWRQVTRNPTRIADLFESVDI